MSFLSSEGLKKLTPPPIEPYHRDRIKYGAYELSVGKEYFCTSNNTKSICKKGKQIEIPSGQFALLISEEIVKIPNNLIAFISFKAKIKFRGLINVSGFHVDPGFRGRLKFSVYNAGAQTIALDPGAPLFMIWFNELDQTTQDVYSGIHNNQMEITADDIMNINGDIASPSALMKRIDKLATKVNTLITVGLIILAALITFLISTTMNQITNNSKTPDIFTEETPRNNNEIMSNEEVAQFKQGDSIPNEIKASNETAIKKPSNVKKSK